MPDLSDQGRLQTLRKHIRSLLDVSITASTDDIQRLTTDYMNNNTQPYIHYPILHPLHLGATPTSNVLDNCYTRGIGCCCPFCRASASAPYLHVTAHISPILLTPLHTNTVTRGVSPEPYGHVPYCVINGVQRIISDEGRTFVTQRIDTSDGAEGGIRAKGVDTYNDASTDLTYGLSSLLTSLSMGPNNSKASHVIKHQFQLCERIQRQCNTIHQMVEENDSYLQWRGQQERSHKESLSISQHHQEANGQKRSHSNIVSSIGKTITTRCSGASSHLRSSSASFSRHCPKSASSLVVSNTKKYDANTSAQDVVSPILIEISDDGVDQVEDDNRQLLSDMERLNTLRQVKKHPEGNIKEYANTSQDNRMRILEPLHQQLHRQYRTNYRAICGEEGIIDVLWKLMDVVGGTYRKDIPIDMSGGCKNGKHDNVREENHHHPRGDDNIVNNEDAAMIIDRALDAYGAGSSSYVNVENPRTKLSKSKLVDKYYSATTPSHQVPTLLNVACSHNSLVTSWFLTYLRTKQIALKTFEYIVMAPFYEYFNSQGGHMSAEAQRSNGISAATVDILVLLPLLFRACEVAGVQGQYRQSFTREGKCMPMKTISECIQDLQRKLQQLSHLYAAAAVSIADAYGDSAHYFQQLPLARQNLILSGENIKGTGSDSGLRTTDDWEYIKEGMRGKLDRAILRGALHPLGVGADITTRINDKFLMSAGVIPIKRENEDLQRGICDGDTISSLPLHVVHLRTMLHKDQLPTVSSSAIDGVGIHGLTVESLLREVLRETTGNISSSPVNISVSSSRNNYNFHLLKCLYYELLTSSTYQYLFHFLKDSSDGKRQGVYKARYSVGTPSLYSLNRMESSCFSMIVSPSNRAILIECFCKVLESCVKDVTSTCVVSDEVVHNEEDMTFLSKAQLFGVIMRRVIFDVHKDILARSEERTEDVENRAQMGEEFETIKQSEKYIAFEDFGICYEHAGSDGEGNDEPPRHEYAHKTKREKYAMDQVRHHIWEPFLGLIGYEVTAAARSIASPSSFIAPKSSSDSSFLYNNKDDAARVASYLSSLMTTLLTISASCCDVPNDEEMSEYDGMANVQQRVTPWGERLDTEENLRAPAYTQMGAALIATVLSGALYVDPTVGLVTASYSVIIEAFTELFGALSVSPTVPDSDTSAEALRQISMLLVLMMYIEKEHHTFLLYLIYSQRTSNALEYSNNYIRSNMFSSGAVLPVTHHEYPMEVYNNISIIAREIRDDAGKSGREHSIDRCRVGLGSNESAIDRPHTTTISQVLLDEERTSMVLAYGSAKDHTESVRCKGYTAIPKNIVVYSRISRILLHMTIEGYPIISFGSEMGRRNSSHTDMSSNTTKDDTLLYRQLQHKILRQLSNISNTNVKCGQEMNNDKKSVSMLHDILRALECFRSFEIPNQLLVKPFCRALGSLHAEKSSNAHSMQKLVLQTRDFLLTSTGVVRVCGHNSGERRRAKEEVVEQCSSRIALELERRQKVKVFVIQGKENLDNDKEIGSEGENKYSSFQNGDVSVFVVKGVNSRRKPSVSQPHTLSVITRDVHHLEQLQELIKKDTIRSKIKIAATTQNDQDIRSNSIYPHSNASSSRTTDNHHSASREFRTAGFGKGAAVTTWWSDERRSTSSAIEDWLNQSLFVPTEMKADSNIWFDCSPRYCSTQSKHQEAGCDGNNNIRLLSRIEVGLHSPVSFPPHNRSHLSLGQQCVGPLAGLITLWLSKYSCKGGSSSVVSMSGASSSLKTNIKTNIECDRDMMRASLQEIADMTEWEAHHPLKGYTNTSNDNIVAQHNREGNEEFRDTRLYSGVASGHVLHAKPARSDPVTYLIDSVLHHREDQSIISNRRDSAVTATFFIATGVVTNTVTTLLAPVPLPKDSEISKLPLYRWRERQASHTILVRHQPTSVVLLEEECSAADIITLQRNLNGVVRVNRAGSPGLQSPVGTPSRKLAAVGSRAESEASTSFTVLSPLAAARQEQSHVGGSISMSHITNNNSAYFHRESTAYAGVSNLQTADLTELPDHHFQNKCIALAAYLSRSYTTSMESLHNSSSHIGGDQVTSEIAKFLQSGVSGSVSGQSNSIKRGFTKCNKTTPTRGNNGVCSPKSTSIVMSPPAVEAPTIYRMLRHLLSDYGSCGVGSGVFLQNGNLSSERIAAVLSSSPSSASADAHMGSVAPVHLLDVFTTPPLSAGIITENDMSAIAKGTNVQSDIDPVISQEPSDSKYVPHDRYLAELEAVIGKTEDSTICSIDVEPLDSEVVLSPVIPQGIAKALTTGDECCTFLLKQCRLLLRAVESIKAERDSAREEVIKITEEKNKLLASLTNQGLHILELHNSVITPIRAELRELRRLTSNDKGGIAKGRDCGEEEII